MWVFLLGATLGGIIGFLTCAIFAVRERTNLPQDLMEIENRFLKEEVEFAHKYFDLLRTPRQFNEGQPLTLTHRIGLVIESLPLIPYAKKKVGE